MKFCKKYEEYMQGEFQKKKKKLPRVGFKQLKKILKRCRRDLHSRNVSVGHSAGDPNLPINRSSCPHRCPGMYAGWSVSTSLLKITVSIWFASGRILLILCCCSIRFSAFIDVFVRIEFVIGVWNYWIATSFSVRICSTAGKIYSILKIFGSYQ